MPTNLPCYVETARQGSSICSSRGQVEQEQHYAAGKAWDRSVLGWAESTTQTGVNPCYCLDHQTYSELLSTPFFDIVSLNDLKNAPLASITQGYFLLLQNS